jgi:uncharacterized integral membrane protein (TIGR00697 family)
MVPASMLEYFTQNQSMLWVFTVCFDLGLTLVMFRWFGKAGLYSVIVLNAVLCNIQALKLTHVFGANTSLGVILYSGIFFATDLLSERYGRREAGRAVMLGFAANIVMVVVMSMTLMFQPTTHGAEKTIVFAAQAHSALSTLFGFTPIIVFGSMTAYLVSQTFDVWLFHRIKEKTGGRHLWLRNTGSTLVSQAIDTAIFGLIVWAPKVGLQEALGIAAFKYIFKFVIAVLDTPFIYWARSWNVRDRDWGYSTNTG